MPAAQRRVIIDLELHIGERLTPALIRQINDGCDRAEDAGANCALLIRFRASPDETAGAVAATGGVHLVNQWERALCRVERLAGVTMALAEGPCCGLVFAVMLATDVRIVNPQFRVSLVGAFGQIMPGMILHRLVQQIGVSRARPLVLFGAELDAAEALRLGLVGDIAQDVGLAAAAFHASMAPAADSDMAMRRRLLLDAATTSFDEGLGAHLAACDRTLRTIERLGLAA